MVKKGFSLAEALVVMAIISILFSVAAKVITTRPKPPKQTTAHGYFECYLNGGLWQRTVIDGVATEPKSMGSQCQFKPQTGVAFYNINSHNPDITRFEPNINNTLNISISGGSFIFNGSTLTSDGGTYSDNTLFFQTMYPNSEIYNGGNMRQGVMISW